VGGDSFLKRERFTSGIYRVVQKNIAQTLTHCHQWRREGMRGGAVAPGGHIEGRHLDPLTT